MRPVSISNPPNPWSSTEVHYLAEEPPPEVKLTVYRDATRRIISRNDSPDIGFDFSVNPYRGCFHACAYCYARPGHEYLGFGAGTDFDRRIVVKPDAPALLRDAFERRMRKASKLFGAPGDPVVFSGVTDCYQPLEASYKLTRACLQICHEFRTPVGLITKAPLIERDIDVLTSLAQLVPVRVAISIPFWDVENARAIEPYVATPQRRIATVAKLAAAGLDVSVNIAPVIPGLNDQDIPTILAAAKRAGARSAGYVFLRLPGVVQEVFEERIRKAVPLRAERILSLIKQSRGGQLYDARFGHRGRGVGPIADNIAQVFNACAKREGLLQQRWASEGATSASLIDGSGPPTKAPAVPLGFPSVGTPRRPQQLRLL